VNDALIPSCAPWSDAAWAEPSPGRDRTAYLYDENKLCAHPECNVIIRNKSTVCQTHRWWYARRVGNARDRLRAAFRALRKARANGLDNVFFSTRDEIQHKAVGGQVPYGYGLQRITWLIERTLEMADYEPPDNGDAPDEEWVPINELVLRNLSLGRVRKMCQQGRFPCELKPDGRVRKYFVLKAAVREYDALPSRSKEREAWVWENK